MEDLDEKLKERPTPILKAKLEKSQVRLKESVKRELHHLELSHHLQEAVIGELRAKASASGLRTAPGRPTQNGYIESFNGKLRDECLNLNCLRNLADARDRIGRWREHYNSSRPHSALGYQAPAQFAAQWNTALTRTAAPGSLALAVQSTAPPIQNRHFSASPLSPMKGEDKKMLHNNPAHSLIVGGR
jgi:hypothetical protein